MKKRRKIEVPLFQQPVHHSYNPFYIGQHSVLPNLHEYLAEFESVRPSHIFEWPPET